MRSNRGLRIIFAVAFSAALILSAGAEASNLFALGGDSVSKPAGERQIGLFEQALNWLTGAWSDLTSGFATAAAEPTVIPTDDNNCESGWGLDPEGCPRP